MKYSEAKNKVIEARWAGLSKVVGLGIWSARHSEGYGVDRLYIFIAFTNEEILLTDIPISDMIVDMIRIKRREAFMEWYKKDLTNCVKTV